MNNTLLHVLAHSCRLCENFCCLTVSGHFPKTPDAVCRCPFYQGCKANRSFGRTPLRFVRK